MKPKCEIDKDGNKYWHLNGKYHREDGPAIIWYNGDKEWWLNGKLHREDGPTIECSDGTKYWYLNGKLHKEDGPAIEWFDGYKWYYLNNNRLTEEEFINHKKYCKICNNQLRHMKAINENIFYCERCKR